MTATPQICRVVPPQTNDICGKPATHCVTFTDGDKASACATCAMTLVETARSFGTIIKTEKL